MLVSSDYNILASILKTTSRSTSRKTSCLGTPQSASLAAPSLETMNAVANDDAQFTSLDPRRFTPTLHANLVSEILSLRREVDSKGKLIVGLEEQLIGAERENEELTALVSNTKQEARDVHRQLHALEGGSDYAIEKLVAERDTATKSTEDLKRRLETVYKKLKARDNDLDRINELWDSDKQQWETQRRNFDRRLHVADSRARTLTAELELTRDFGVRRGGPVTDGRPLSEAQKGRQAERAQREVHLQ